jgi:hypothetical protein
MLRIEPRLAFITGVLLANRVLIFRFQLLAVYVLLVHNCGECRITQIYRFLMQQHFWNCCHVLISILKIDIKS